MEIDDIKVGDRLLVTGGAHDMDKMWGDPKRVSYHFIREGALVVVDHINEDSPESEQVYVKPVNDSDWLNDGVDDSNYVWPQHLTPAPSVNVADLTDVEAFLNG